MNEWFYICGYYLQGHDCVRKLAHHFYYVAAAVSSDVVPLSSAYRATSRWPAQVSEWVIFAALRRRPPARWQCASASRCPWSTRRPATLPLIKIVELVRPSRHVCHLDLCWRGIYFPAQGRRCCRRQHLGWILQPIYVCQQTGIPRQCWMKTVWLIKTFKSSELQINISQLSIRFRATMPFGPNTTWLVTSRLDTTRHVRRVEPMHFVGTCEASWFDSISNRTSDSRFDS